MFWRYMDFEWLISYASKNMAYLESAMEAMVFYILICWKWFGANHKQAFCTVLWTKNAIYIARNYRCTIKCTKMCHCSILRLKLPTTSKVYAIMLRILCMFNISLVAYAIGRRITILALKPHGRKVWFMVQYLAIPYPITFFVYYNLG